MNHSKKSLESQELINAIHNENRRRGWNLQDSARHLGISHIHMASLTNGARKISGLKRAKQRILADFLGISLVDLFLFCGILRREDFPEGHGLPVVPRSFG